MKNKEILKLVIAALMLALGMVLPFLTGQIPTIGNMISPMHIPAFLCGFLCGPFYGVGVGVVLPILRSVIFGMPPMMPTAIAMSIELGVYGLTSGLLLNILKNKTSLNVYVRIYISLICAMIIGRCAWGVSRYFLSVINEGVFNLDMFLAGAFINAWVGIIIHLIVVPAVIAALERAKLIEI